MAWIASDAVARARREAAADRLIHSRMLAISVLGPVEVRRDGRASLPVPAGKTSELLVRLALEAGALVRADRLVEDLWAADAVDTRRNTLQSKVARLRRALGDPGRRQRRRWLPRSTSTRPTSTRSRCCAAAAAARLLEAGDHDAARRAVRLGAAPFRGDVLPARATAMGGSAPHPPRRGPPAAARDRLVGPAAARRRRR